MRRGIDGRSEGKLGGGEQGHTTLDMHNMGVPIHIRVKVDRVLAARVSCGKGGVGLKSFKGDVRQDKWLRERRTESVQGRTRWQAGSGVCRGVGWG